MGDAWVRRIAPSNWLPFSVLVEPALHGFTDGGLAHPPRILHLSRPKQVLVLGTISSISYPNTSTAPQQPSPSRRRNHRAAIHLADD